MKRKISLALTPILFGALTACAGPETDAGTSICMSGDEEIVMESEEYGMTYDLDAWGGDAPIHASFAPFQWPGTGKSSLITWARLLAMYMGEGLGERGYSKGERFRC